MPDSSVAATAQSMKASSPIEPLPTDLARIVTHIQPVLLLSAYYLRFPSLVSDPVASLLVGLIPLTIVQATYCVVCLPPTGTTTGAVKRTQKGKTSVPKKTADGFSATNVVPLILSLALTLLSTPLLFAVQVLFGAPLTTHLPHTLLSSAHLALLVIFPLVYVHGVDSHRWLEVFSGYSPFDQVFGGAVGACVGAWLGAVPIPLDWDREWQKWPVTIVTGCYLGYVVGKTLGGWSLVRGRRMDFQ